MAIRQQQKTRQNYASEWSRLTPGLHLSPYVKEDFNHPLQQK